MHNSEYLDLVESGLIASEQEIKSRVIDPSLMCKIYFCFSKPSESSHNCLGCNLSDAVIHVSNFLEVYNKTDVLAYGHHVCSEYFMLLNTIWERISDVFEIINYKDELRCKHFSSFIETRRWANFFKHPREFGWMVHHPKFIIEGSCEHNSIDQLDGESLVIDGDFVKRFYSSSSAKGLSKQFANKDLSVFVAIPNLKQLTIRICDSLETFVAVIEDNKAYQELLADRTTILNYYDKQRETLPNRASHTYG